MTGFIPPVVPTVTSLGGATSTWANLVKEGYDWLVSSNKTDSRPYAVLGGTSAQTLPAATVTDITLDTEYQDVGNGHTGTSASYIIPTAGVWMLSATATFGSTTSGNIVAAQIMVGTAIVARETRVGIGAVQAFMVGTGLATCAVGDVVKLQQSSVAASTTDITITHPYLFAYWLSS